MYCWHSWVDALKVTCVVIVILSWVSFSNRYVSAEFFKTLTFVITSAQEINGQLECFRTSGTVAFNLRVSVDGFIHQMSWISWYQSNWLTIKTRCFSSECNHCSMAAMSVRLKNRSIFSGLLVAVGIPRKQLVTPIAELFDFSWA